MRTVHVHLHRRTSDMLAVGLAALYEDLARRMAGALREVLGRTHDGEWKEYLHPRRTDGKFGVGPVDAAEKPTVAAAKGGMDKIRELLASGHAFTKAELLSATGLTEKRLSDYLAMLKNPKWAGAKGALQIARRPDGSYFVATAEGAPAPPAPKPEAPVAVDPKDQQHPQGDADERIKETRELFNRLRTEKPGIDRDPGFSRAMSLHLGNAENVTRYGPPGLATQERAHKHIQLALGTMMEASDRWNAARDVKEAAERLAKEAREGRPMDTKSPWTDKAKTKDVSAAVMKMGLVDHADFGRLDPGIANDMARSLHDHLAEFPALRANQNFVGSIQAHSRWYVQKVAANLVARTGGTMTLERAMNHVQKPKAPGRAWAVAWGGGWDGWDGTRGIGFNEKYGTPTEAAKMVDSLKHNTGSRWHPVGCDTIKSIADHEYGHQLDQLLQLRSNPELKRIRKEAHGGQAAHTARTPYESVEVPIGPNAKTNVTQAVSAYAATNAAEFIAESWAEFKNNPNPRPVAVRVGNLIRSEYAKQFPHPSQA